MYDLLVVSSKLAGVGGDEILQYHPADISHHSGGYFKISSGETRTIRIDLDGNIIE